MSYNYDDDLAQEAAAMATADMPNFRVAGEEDNFEQGFESMQMSNQNQQFQQDIYIPEIIKSFIIYFYKTLMRDRNVFEVNSIYEISYNKLTERHFKTSPWPQAESIAPLVDDDPLFLILYKELYYRHIYSKLQPTLEQRFESFNNYVDLFDVFLNSPDMLVELPNQWLWDIVDEYIYQFQAYCQHRAKLKNRNEEEVRIMRDNPQVWSVQSVLNTLHALISQSRIYDALDVDTTSVENAKTGTSDTFKTLGYFSIIGLLRVHCLLGDYHLALKVLDKVEPLKSQGLFFRVTPCYITLYYYMGFAYMMMRRYVDAVKVFTRILLYISRTKQYHTRSYQYDQIIKKHDQMYALLSLCLSVCPQRVDEAVHSTLRDKYAEKMIKLQRNDWDEFFETFSYACPKFITPSAPNFEEAANTSQDAFKLQAKMFVQEMKQQALLPTLRSFLKLYTTISIKKLADLMETDESSLTTHLMCLKHKTCCLSFSGGAHPLTGKYTSVSDVDFFLVKDMVHIQDQKVGRDGNYSEFFINQINKFENLTKDVQAFGKSAPAPQGPM